MYQEADTWKRKNCLHKSSVLSSSGSSVNKMALGLHLCEKTVSGVSLEND